MANGVTNSPVGGLSNVVQAYSLLVKAQLNKAGAHRPPLPTREGRHGA